MRITKAITVKARWNAFTFPIKPGTPVSIKGVPANNGSAVGIVPQEIKVQPNDEYITLMVGGDVDAYDIGYPSLATAAKQSMNGIVFYGTDGTPDIDPVYDPYTLPAATETTLGGVMMAENVAEAAGDNPTAAEFKALLDALIAAGIMAEADT